MAATDEMVAGAGWISDDSSFYGEHNCILQHTSRHSSSNRQSQAATLQHMPGATITTYHHFTSLVAPRSTQLEVPRDADRMTGDENEQEYQESLSNQNTPKAFWSSHSKDLNAIVSPAKLQARKEVASDVDTTPTKKPMPLTTSTRANKLPGFSGFDRKTMEEERLARLGKGKRKRDLSPEPTPRRELFNPMEGQSYSWQLGETAEAFVKRVPPLSTSALTCEWIWAANPYRDPRDKSTTPRVAAFRDRGAKLLADSLRKRDEIQEKGRLGSRSTVTRAWNQEAKALQQSLTKLAVETGVLSGKVSLIVCSE